MTLHHALLHLNSVLVRADFFACIDCKILCISNGLADSFSMTAETYCRQYALGIRSAA